MKPARQRAMISHIKLREGVIDHVYRDSLGKLTGGVGHLLEGKEYSLGLFEEGDNLVITTIDNWLKEDLQVAQSAAREQAYLIPYCSISFEDALVSVNFQLGTSWYKKFPTAWKHLTKGDFHRAKAEIQYTKEGSKEYSNWMKQTPIRVKDFLVAIDGMIYTLPTRVVTREYGNCKTIIR